MRWIPSNLLRLALADEARDLSDQARGLVPTYADRHRAAGDLVAEFDRLAYYALALRDLAIATERALGTSWEQIGAALGDEDAPRSRQAVQARFGPVVRRLREDVLLPKRDSTTPGEPGRLVGPAAIHDPDAAAERLDAWVARHAERADPVRGHDDAVSSGLTANEWADLELGAAVSELHRWLVDEQLPAGVSPTIARLRCAEMLYHAAALAERRGVASNAGGAQQRSAADEAFDRLVSAHRDVFAPRVTTVADSPGRGRVLLDGRPVAAIALNASMFQSSFAPGWYAHHPEFTSDTPDTWYNDEPIAGVDASLDDALAAGTSLVLTWMASDAARGTAPFDRLGLAGPPSTR